jgi:predicted dehydrogenase
MTSQQSSSSAARSPFAQVRLGVIGFGTRGQQLARLASMVPGCVVVAVADAYDGHLSRARELLGERVQTSRDPRTLLENREVDGVAIATPDHLHVPLAIESAGAGKHVYCETPVLHSTEDGTRLTAAFSAAGVRFSGASGAAVSPLILAARDMIAAGKIGKPVLVRATWDTAGALDAWQTPFPPDASPETVDFTLFDPRRGASAFDTHRFFRWRCFWEYGSGLAGARVAPLVAATQVLTGVKRMTRVTASGAMRRWKERQVPDLLSTTIDYEDLTLQVSASLVGPEDRREIVIVGTEGSLRIVDDELSLIPEPQAEPYADIGETWAKEYRDWFYMMHGMSQQGQVRGTPPLEQASERFVLPATPASEAAPLADFVDAIRSARPPRESLADAISAADTAIAVAAAAREGKVWTRA